MFKNKDKDRLVIGAIIVAVVLGLTIYSFIKDEKTSAHVEEITYSEYKDKVAEDKKSIILVGRNDCSHCISYKPVVEKVAEEYDITVYYINTNNIENEDDFNALWDFIGTTGTPTTAIVQSGNLVAVTEGEKTRTELIAFLKANYF